MAKKKPKAQSRQDQLARAKQIIKEAYEEFPEKSTEFCLAIAEDRAEMENLTVSIYDAL